ncbi:MAG TPA: hypothetical protein VIL36_09250 [Acidimicrobiales bacterium]
MSDRPPFLDPAAGRGGADDDDLDLDLEVDPASLAESDFAVRHGIVGASPDVVVDGAAVRRAREAAGLTTTDVALAMTRRGYPTDAAGVAAIEDSPAQRLRPREARLLAAIVDLPLAAVEARPQPWPAQSADVTSLRAAGVETVVLGDDVVVRTAGGAHLGLLRCAGEPDVLDARTYRLAAAALLNGAWAHLAGALLVTARPPHFALAVDALDCVPRSHAPTGLSGFTRLADPVPLAEAVAAYDDAYAISWTDPEPLDDLLAGRGPGAGGTGSGAAGEGASAERLAEVVADLARQARRARQPGKQAGYERAAAWLGSLDADDLAAFLDEVAGLPPDEARRRLEEVVT